MKNVVKFNVIVFVFASIVSGQNVAPQIVVNEAERLSQDSFGFLVKSKKGAVVYAVSAPSRETLAAIDKGLTDLFVVARKNGYKKKLKYSDYTIFVAKPDRQKDFEGKYSPDLAVDAKQYAGTLYDKGGYIYAAGIVVAFQPCAFMIGEHTKDFDRISNVVRYEGEHIVLFHNDMKRYRETADHSKGGAHPILQ